MKRLQILIDEDLDEQLELLALTEHTSKAALIRRFVRERLPAAPGARDPLYAMAGTDDFEPDSIDDVVYS